MPLARRLAARSAISPSSNSWRGWNGFLRMRPIGIRATRSPRSEVSVPEGVVALGGPPSVGVVAVEAVGAVGAVGAAGAMLEIRASSPRPRRLGLSAGMADGWRWECEAGFLRQ